MSYKSKPGVAIIAARNCLPKPDIPSPKASSPKNYLIAEIQIQIRGEQNFKPAVYSIIVGVFIKVVEDDG
jgi:hypothetical protein